MRKEEKAWVMSQNLLYLAYHNKTGAEETPVLLVWFSYGGKVVTTIVYSLLRLKSTKR
jgi:hypothetical protein